jgi:hypothetical protein
MTIGAMFAVSGFLRERAEEVEFLELRPNHAAHSLLQVVPAGIQG